MAIARDLFSTQPEDIISWKHVGIGYKGSTNNLISLPYGNRAGHFAIPMSGAFKHPSSAARNILMEYGHDSTPGLSRKYGTVDIVRTSNVVFAYSDRKKNGPAFTLDDVRGFDGWLAATDRNRAIEYVKTPEFKHLIAARHERPVDFMENPAYPKYVTDILAFNGPINEVGKRWTQAWTLGYNLKKFDRSIVGKEMAYRNSGFGEEIKYLGVIAQEGTIYAIGRLQDGKVVLLRGHKADKYLSDMAKGNFLPLEDAINLGIGEEVMHNIRKSYDKSRNIEERIAEEIATKQEHLEIVRNLAEREVDPRLRVRYERMARTIEKDIATTEARYRSHYERLQGKKSSESLEEDHDTLEDAVAEERNMLDETIDELAEEIDYDSDKYSESALEDYVTDGEVSEAVNENYEEGTESVAANDNYADSDDGAEETSESEAA